MATNRNDDMDRKGNLNTDRNTGQGSTGSQGGMHKPNTPGGTSHEQMGQTGRDPVNRDREMNRDTEVGQGSTGSGQSGRDTFGSTNEPNRETFGSTDRTKTAESEMDRNRTSGTDRSTGTDTSRNTGRGPSDISE